MIICITEDRAEFEVPVKLLLLSLAKHCEDLAVKLFYPPATDNFTAWIKQFSQVDLDTRPLPGAKGWNVKPQALLALLEAGNDTVLWIDSDIIVTRDFRNDLNRLNSQAIVATEEALWGNYSDTKAWRAQRWGLSIGREFPFTLNTAVLRVTRSHIPLLLEWQRLLDTEAYKCAQVLHADQRPGHMFGDQDVLTALLTSREFSDIEVRFLRRGSDIIQYFGLSGYTCAERLRNIINGPARFVHSQVFKPWVKFKKPRSIENVRDFLDSLYLDLSPYTLAALKYKRDLKESCPWMRPQSVTAALMRILGLWHAPLVGLPIAAMADFVRITNLRSVKRFYFRRVSLHDESAVEHPVSEVQS
jgi:hypothetical protein